MNFTSIVKNVYDVYDLQNLLIFASISNSFTDFLTTPIANSCSEKTLTAYIVQCV